MVSQCLVILCLASVFSYTSSTQAHLEDDIGPDNLKHPSTIKVGRLQEGIILDKYYNHTELEDLLKYLGERYKQIVRVEALGQSAVDNTTIWAVQISRGVQRPRKLRKPMVKFVANLNGDEAVGYALLTSLIQYLVYIDGNDIRVTELLDNIDIWIVPTLNPDGFRRSKMGQCSSLEGFEGKTNGNGKQLDKDFPIFSEWKRTCPKDFLTSFKGDYQPETKIISTFIMKHPFVLSGNLQGGAIVAQYLYCSRYLATTRALALNYATGHSIMKTGNACNRYFEKGITFAKVNLMTRDMQHFNFLFRNCLEINIYLSCCKYPHSSKLPAYWAANLNPMLSFIQSARQGVYGIVKDIWNQPIKNAVIYVNRFIEENNRPISVTARGEYWILLTTGEYYITASANEFNEKTKTRVLSEKNPHVKLDFKLKKPLMACCSDQAHEERLARISQKTNTKLEKKSTLTEDEKLVLGLLCFGCLN